MGPEALPRHREHAVARGGRDRAPGHQPEPLPTMADFARHSSRALECRSRVSTTTDRRAALDGADYVVVRISTGGFDSMRHDLEIPERHGIKQSVGDTRRSGRRHARAAQHPGARRHRARHGRDLSRRVDAQHHQPDDDAVPGGHARDRRSQTVGLCHEITRRAVHALADFSTSTSAASTSTSSA